MNISQRPKRPSEEYATMNKFVKGITLPEGWFIDIRYNGLSFALTGWYHDRPHFKITIPSGYGAITPDWEWLKAEIEKDIIN